MLQMKGVTKNFWERGMRIDALKGIDLSFPERGLFFLVGKSGSGKSTLLNLIGGLDMPTAGDIVYRGQSLNTMSSEKRSAYRMHDVGFIFQEDNLFPSLTVRQNILFSDADADCTAIAERLGIETLLDCTIDQLSGGQRQRAAIARALIHDCRILLADEPTGSLDENMAQEIFTLLKEFSKERLVLVVTHDERSAENFGDCIIHLQDGAVVSTEERVESISQTGAGQSREHSEEVDIQRPKKRGRTYLFSVVRTMLLGRGLRGFISMLMTFLMLCCMEAALLAVTVSGGAAELAYVKAHSEQFPYAIVPFGDELMAGGVTSSLAEDDALLYHGMGFAAKSLEQLAAFGFKEQTPCSPMQSDVFYFNKGAWGDAEVLHSTYLDEGSGRLYQNCILVDGEEVAFVERGAEIEDCVGKSFKLYAVFMPQGYAAEDVPTLTLGGVVRDGWSAKSADGCGALILISGSFIFYEGDFPTAWGKGGIFAVSNPNFEETIRALSKAGVLASDDIAETTFPCVTQAGETSGLIDQMFRTTASQIRGMSSYLLAAFAVLALVYLLLMFFQITAVVRERSSEIALIAALGFSRGKLTAALAASALLLTLTPLAVALGTMPLWTMLLNAIYAPTYGGSTITVVMVNGSSVLAAVLLALIAALLAFLMAALSFGQKKLSLQMRRKG